MSLLTQAEIEAINVRTLGHQHFAKEVEAAVIARLATVSVEPEPFATTSGMVYLYTEAALAAARVQAYQELATEFDGLYTMGGDDVEGAVGARVRGWGRLGYMPNGAELQDEIGQMLADALNELYAGVRAGMATVKESLTTGKQRLQVPTGWAAPKDQYAVPVLFNPYTGEPRDVRDVQSDPQGILIVPPGKVNQLAAMQGGQQP